MRILVTGGTGFTGSALVRRLLRDGHEVYVLDAAEGLFLDELKDLGAKVELGTIEHRSVCEKAVEWSAPNVVYHLAAAFRRIVVSRKHYWDVNVEGTRWLCDAARQHGARKFVYCSTQGVHGHIADPPGDERSPIEPEDYYQYTKWEGERVVNEIIANTGFDATTVRPTAIYGPGDPARFLMMFKRSLNGRFLMFGDGRTMYHPVYIDNLIDCLLLAAEKGRKGEAYLCADEHYYTLDDLITFVGRAMGVDVKIRHVPYWPLYVASLACEGVCAPLRITPPLFRRRASWFTHVRAFRIDKARRELDYAPRVGIHEGLTATAKWYVENGHLPATLRVPAIERAREADTSGRAVV